jgi:hypothetical protein
MSSVLYFNPISVGIDKQDESPLRIIAEDYVPKDMPNRAIILGLFKGNPEITLEGGDGDTKETAIKFAGANQFQGVILETVWRVVNHPDHGFSTQKLVSEGGKYFDVMTFVNPSTREKIDVWFDVTDIMGKI